MAEEPVAVLDTNVLLTLATPVVDTRSVAPSGGDPLRAVLTGYTVNVPESVVGEVGDATGSDALLSAAADAVLRASDRLTTHAVEGRNEPAAVGLDGGELDAIALANDLGADLFVTDEFNSTNYLLVAQALADRNTLYTTPHVLCSLARHGALDRRSVDALLTYFLETKQWSRTYVGALRREYLDT